MNITVDNILSTFTRPRRQKRIDVVAMYIYPDWRNTEDIVTDYLNHEELSKNPLTNFFLKRKCLKQKTTEEDAA